MKVLLFFEKQNMIKQSGIGRALRHQKAALESAGIEYTLDSNDTYDIAHINTLFPQSYRVLKKCKKKNIPVIVHGHSTKEDFANSFRCWKLIRPFFHRSILKMYRAADYIITPTVYSKGLISNYKGVNCPVYAVSNGIALEEYKDNPSYVDAFKKAFNITNEKVVIGAGLFFQRKGLIDFFEVARKMPDVKFIWFSHLKKIMTQPKILRAIKHKPSNVIMPGYVDFEVIRGGFLGADVFFFPSYEENEGIVMLEALATKTPTVVRNIGVYNPWLKDGQTTLMGNNVDEFIEKIDYALNNDMTEIVNKGFEIVSERSIDKIGQQLKAIYRSIFSN